MNYSTTPRTFSTLRAARNTRTRIFTGGSDPLFSGSLRSSALSNSRTGVPEGRRVTPTATRWFDPGVLDRLEPAVSRRHE